MQQEYVTIPLLDVDALLRDNDEFMANPADSLELNPVSPGIGWQTRHPGMYIPMKDRFPFDRQEGETDFQWWAFQEYLAQGILRSVAETKRRMVAKCLYFVGKDNALSSMLSKLLKAWAWKIRAEAFDKQVEFLESLNKAKDIEQMNIRQSEIALTVLEMCVVEVEKYHKLSMASPDPVMTVPHLAKLIQLGLSAERVARGEPAVISRIQSEVADGQDKKSMRKILADPEKIDLLNQLAEMTEGSDTGKEVN